MSVSRLREIPGIGVDTMGDAADAAGDPDLLRLENLDTDIRPPQAALDITHARIDDDDANSYLPFAGHHSLRQAAAAHVERTAGRSYDPLAECVSVAGGLNGILNVLFATIEPGQEVVLTDPIYAGLINRVRLAGGIPRFVSSTPAPDGWHIDPDELAAAVGPKTAAVLPMSPAMPTGAVLDERHWEALVEPVNRHKIWIVYDAAMERIRFDGRAPSHPASHPELAARTITVGSASKELRLIGWRVGWVVAPAEIMADIHLVGLTNVVCQVGIAQQAVAAVLDAADGPSGEQHSGDPAGVATATRTWQQRCDTILAQLRGYPCVPPHGGWSLLIDTAALGLTPAEASARLFQRGRVAATPLEGWGPAGNRYIRLVYANEPVDRLTDLKERFRDAFG